MNKLVLSTICRLQRYNDERGAGMAEYALLLFAVAVLSIGVMTTFASDIQAIFTDAGTQLPGPTP